jgi:hypothetical protein
MTGDRIAIIALVQRLMAGDFASEEEADRLVAEFEASVPHPRASDLIYHPKSEGFRHEPSAAEVVDRAFQYRAIEL